MRGFRLSGWQRIGIVLSLVWAICALVYFWQEEEARIARYQKAHYECLFAPNSDQSLCDAKFEAVNGAIRMSEVNLLLRALAPIPIAWVAIYIVVWTVRWIRRGFQPST
jgi:hypothetical protein